MPSYLVESYLADSPALVEQERRRALRAAELGDGVRYIRTTFLPGDETVLHVFEAPSMEAVTHAGRLAALAFERIVEAIEPITGPDCVFTAADDFRTLPNTGPPHAERGCRIEFPQRGGSPCPE